MHLDNPAQLSFKEDIFRQALQRIAHIGDPPPVRLHQSPARYGYRFRARLQIKGADAGFYKRQTSDIISWDTCMQLPETLNVAVKVLRKILRGDDSSGWLSVCETAASPVNGAVTFHWHLDKGKGSRDRANGIFDRAEELTALENISLAGQTADDRKGRAIASRGGSLILNVKGASLRASPGTFFQVNPGVNEVLVERVLSHLASAGAGSLLDLYCGNGNFSLPAADSGIKTFGVESSGKAISDALGAAGPESGFVEEDVTVFLSRDEGSYDAVIVDPPRTGLPPEAAAILGVKRPRTLLYVSCEPSTLARDLARFIGYGFTVTGMELFDMFPQTSHMEALVVMQG
jgi:23S rRNA (uracil1939-C5)-methyltransferase